MHRSWTRHIGAWLCVAIVLFAALASPVSPGHPDHFTAILTALWLVVPAVTAVVVCRLAVRSDEQPASLLSLAGFRAPPATLPLV